MKSLAAKHWFLLLLAAGLGLAAWGPAWLRAAAARLEPRAVVAASLFLVAFGLESRRLLDAVLRPWPALWAVAISYVALPAFAALAGRLLEDDYRVGLLLMASVPCTLASAVLWTRLAGGNEATALLTILLTTATSWLITTAWLVGCTGTAVRLDAGRMVADLFLFLVVPVALAQALRASRPLAGLAARHRLGLGVAARLLVFSMIVKAAVEVRDRLVERGDRLEPGPLLAAAALCLGAHLLALAGGLYGGRGLGFDRPSRIAVAFACSQKTLPVALLLFTTYYQEAYPLAVVPVVIYHVGQFVVDTFIAEGLAGRAPALQAGAAA